MIRGFSSSEKLIITCVLLGVVAVSSWLLSGFPFFGKSELTVTLAVAPPNEVYPGDTFEMVVEVISEGGGDIKDLVICLDMPEGFWSKVIGTNTRTVGLGSLSFHGGVGQGFLVMVSKDVHIGSYTLGIRVTADNVSPHILSPTVKVVKK